jgi:hypothetical protein
MLKASFGMSALAVFACIALASCSSGTIVPPAVVNMSGDFSGTFQDSVYGSAPATATFAQHGNNAGGSITIAYPSGTVVAQTSFTIAPVSNALSGTLVIDYPTAQCTFSTTGTFDPKTNAVNVTFAPITNCAGETGSYTMSQQCTATTTSAADRRALSVPFPC